MELFANKVRIPSANIFSPPSHCTQVTLNIFTYEGAGGEVEVGLFTSRICGRIPSATNVFNCSHLFQ